VNSCGYQYWPKNTYVTPQKYMCNSGSTVTFSYEESVQQTWWICILLKIIFSTFKLTGRRCLFQKACLKSYTEFIVNVITWDRNVRRVGHYYLHVWLRCTFSHAFVVSVGWLKDLLREISNLKQICRVHIKRLQRYGFILGIFLICNY
jgi:hypothetical protein